MRHPNAREKGQMYVSSLIADNYLHLKSVMQQLWDRSDMLALRIHGLGNLNTTISQQP